MGQIRGQGAKALVELSECFAERQERSGLQHQGIILTGRALQEEAELVVFVCFIPLLAVRKADKFLQESLPVGTCYHSGDPYILVHSGLSDFWNCLVVQQSHRDCTAVQGSAHLQLSHSLLQVFSGIPGDGKALQIAARILGNGETLRIAARIRKDNKTQRKSRVTRMERCVSGWGLICMGY